MDVRSRNNVVESGVAGGQPMVFAHGFGCDQHMWRHVVPAFENRFRTVVFDHVGFGRSDLAAFDPERHTSLQGYADDLIEVCVSISPHPAVFVGHSVSAMIGVRAALTAPGVFDRLVLIGPSPRYIDDDGYVGGFGEADIDDLLASLDDNYLGWSSAMAPVIMGNADRPELGEELTSSFCATDPAMARSFARVTFLSDSRADLPRVAVPTLVVQSREDAIAAPTVGAYVHDHIPGSEMVVLDATGHCPNLSAPAETIAAIAAFVPDPA
ncbi:MAG TPA: alpha/beta hydrolase [Iamia sp.]|nr:alpha/beta hydrolase [Iamia sp.]